MLKLNMIFFFNKKICESVCVKWYYFLVVVNVFLVEGESYFDCYI